ncbi:MAG: VWA domain-containing protein [Gammaproteobacteria bacterium]|nr:VWA domain-containing protein [Gammaproteobacteria bacterium]
MVDKPDKLPVKSTSAEVDAFLAKVAGMPTVKSADGKGRLIFAMDATASREPSWDVACNIQAEMFKDTATLGGLDIQLCYYRGFNEFFASGWLSSSARLLEQMSGVHCAGGMTQIKRVFAHAIRESRRDGINALVFVGDCMEEDVDQVCELGGQLGILGIPAFLFHEGFDPVAKRTFGELARLTKGAYCRFDAGSASQLRDLLGAVAVYAAGGRKALEHLGDQKGGLVKQLTDQMTRE